MAAPPGPKKRPRSVVDAVAEPRPRLATLAARSCVPLPMDELNAKSGPIDIKGCFGWVEDAVAGLGPFAVSNLLRNLQRLTYSSHCSGMGCLEQIMSQRATWASGAAGADAGRLQRTHASDIFASRQLVLSSQGSPSQGPGVPSQGSPARGPPAMGPSHGSPARAPPSQRSHHQGCPSQGSPSQGSPSQGSLPPPLRSGA